jgi:hypothetical protein
VPASLVRAILDAAFLIAVGIWMGSTLFVLGGVLPLVDRSARGPLLRRWYAWGVTCGAVALPAAVGAPLSYPEYRGVWAGVQAFLIVGATLAMLDGANRPAPEDRQARRAVTLGAGVLVVHVVLLVGFAFRPPPRTVGIIEPTPQQRAQRAAQAGVR